mmetsp:Transcript_13737/g.28202  ORF Transcript_13737/g.28202 Transcript_13737/m.28202 type:complete len:93 (+) Transcript_13737:1141-1419(+)
MVRTFGGNSNLDIVQCCSVRISVSIETHSQLLTAKPTEKAVGWPWTEKRVQRWPPESQRFFLPMTYLGIENMYLDPTMHFHSEKERRMGLLV